MSKTVVLYKKNIMKNITRIVLDKIEETLGYEVAFLVYATLHNSTVYTVN